MPQPTATHAVAWTHVRVCPIVLMFVLCELMLQICLSWHLVLAAAHPSSSPC